MTLSIKNMVCTRCKMIVQLELMKLGVHCISIELGRVETRETISAELMNKIRIAFSISGLELMDNKKSTLGERIKNVIIQMIHDSDSRLKTRFSNHLSEKLGLDYTYLANVFSEQQGTTIERFIIQHKIEHIKELMKDDELNLTEISWKMHYSSVAHLSNQFKKVTGVTPSYYKRFECKSPSALQKV